MPLAMFTRWFWLSFGVVSSGSIFVVFHQPDRQPADRQPAQHEADPITGDEACRIPRAQDVKHPQQDQQQADQHRGQRPWVHVQAQRHGHVQPALRVV